MTGRPPVRETGSSHRYANITEADLLVSAADAIAQVATDMGYEQYLLFGLSREPEQGEVGVDAPFRTIVEAQGREMAAIARELHDDTVQNLANALAELEAVANEAGLEEDVRDAIESATDSIDLALRRVLELSCSLHPPVIDKLGLAAALRNLVKKMNADFPVDLKLVTIGSEGDLPSEVKLNLYRIAQEALRNVVKHSGAKEALVCLSLADDGIDLVIDDDGSGCASSPTADSRAYLGLASMRERTARIGGTFDCRTGQRGVTVKVHVP
jgi:two-component system sensor histidine kinase DegS